ncbi:MAG: DNA-binding protein [Candidatus Rokuibacteriota bacterium]|nr:MAG: DNA-binding protein [Candidatus Rokubacteria bacterium]
MTPEVEVLLGKARRSLANARRSTDGGDHDFATSRAYYAMFYAAEALLIVEGLTFSKHSAVISEFTRLFVRPGKLPENLAIDFREAFEQRGVGDYGFVENLPPETAARVIANAATFVDAVERLLREEP